MTLAQVLEPPGHALAGGVSGVGATDVARGLPAALGRPLALVEHLAHQVRGVLHVGLGPLALGGVGGRIWADRHHAVLDQEAVGARS